MEENGRDRGRADRSGGLFGGRAAGCAAKGCPPFVDCALAHATVRREGIGNRAGEVWKGHPVQSCQDEGAQFRVCIDPGRPSRPMRAPMVAKGLNRGFKRVLNALLNCRLQGGLRPIQRPAGGFKFSHGKAHLFRCARHGSAPASRRAFSILRTVTSETRNVRAICATLHPSARSTAAIQGLARGMRRCNR